MPLVVAHLLFMLDQPICMLDACFWHVHMKGNLDRWNLNTSWRHEILNQEEVLYLTISCRDS
jgi:hypothetical protein